MMQRKCFIYLLCWDNINRYYLGCRYGIKNTGPSSLGTTYFTSSKKVRALWAYAPPTRIVILKELDCPITTVEEESAALSYFSAHLNPLFLNSSTGSVFDPRNQVGKVIPAKSRKKMSDAAKNRYKKGYVPANKGKAFSEETKAKIKEARAKQTITKESRTKAAETRIAKRLSGEMIHPGFSEETRLKMSIAAKNRPPPSEETIRKRTEAVKRRWALKKQHLNDPK